MVSYVWNGVSSYLRENVAELLSIDLKQFTLMYQTGIHGWDYGVGIQHIHGLLQMYEAWGDNYYVYNWLYAFHVLQSCM